MCVARFLLGLPVKGGFACFSKLIYNFTMQAYDSHATPVVRDKLIGLFFTQTRKKWTALSINHW